MGCFRLYPVVNIEITSESYGVYLKGPCHPSYSLIAVWSVILELLTAICSITVSSHYMQSSADSVIGPNWNNALSALAFCMHLIHQCFLYLYILQTTILSGIISVVLGAVAFFELAGQLSCEPRHEPSCRALK